jgi:hypothetical protein
MKSILIFTLLVIGTVANAQFKTADNINYIVLLNDEISAEDKKFCQVEICRLAEASGTGECEIVFNISTTTILAANLSSRAADLVSQMGCVSSIRPDEAVQAQPSIGKSN